MYNFAMHNRSIGSPAQLHYLFPSLSGTEQLSVRQALAGLGTAHFCAPDLSSLGRFGTVVDQLLDKSGLDEHIITSLGYYTGLLKAEGEAGGPFDLVEFPDFGGWASATIAAKRARFAFETTRIAIRLHSTCGIIVSAEPYYHRPSLWLSAITDLERHCLAEADHVVGHLDGIVTFNQQFYGLTEAWRDAAVVEFPLILAEPIPRQTTHLPRRFLFSSRLQPFKCPDLFIRAAVSLLQQTPDFDGEFVLASYGWDTHYIDWLRSLVPLAWHDRIRFVFDLPGAEREQLIGGSIIVIPSIYESLCLFAYESVASGCTVILNRRCLAFGETPRWRENANCLMFDGSFADLAEVMLSAADWQPTAPVDMVPDIPYWAQAEPAALASGRPSRQLSLAVISLGLETLESVNSLLLNARVREACDRLHVVVPRVLFARHKVEPSMIDGPDLQIHLSDWSEPAPTEIDRMLRSIDEDLVMFWPTGMTPDSIFNRIARDLLAADPDLSGVTSHTLVAADNRTRSIEGVRLYGGDLPSIAVGTSRVCHRASMFRREALIGIEIREEAADRWFEEMVARLVDAGEHILCLPAAPVIESVSRRRTRISDEIYYATRRAEVSLGAGLPARLDAVDDKKTSDFSLVRAAGREGEADIGDEAPELITRAYFTEPRITAGSGSAADDYRDITIGIRSLKIGSRFWDEQFMKVAIYRGAPQIEFREQGDMIFDSWPPATRDEWGAVLEYSPASSGAKLAASEASIAALPELDRRRLGVIVEALPGMVSAATAPANFERAAWISVAEELRRFWLHGKWSAGGSPAIVTATSRSSLGTAP